MALPALTIFLIGQTLLFSGVNSIHKEYFYRNKLNNICKEYKNFVTSICRNTSEYVTKGECESIGMEFTLEENPDEGGWIEPVVIAVCTNEDGNIVYCASTSTDETTFFAYHFDIHNNRRDGHCRGTPAVRTMPQEVVEAIRKKRKSMKSRVGRFLGYG